MARLDLRRVLTPIPGEAPGGEDLRYDPLVDEIAELRRADDPNAPQGIWKTKLKAADWPGVLRVAMRALETRTKDLQLAAWAAEALVALDGLKGLAEGAELLAGLVERHWPHLWPAIDGDDLELRLSPILWFDEKLPMRVVQLPLAAGEPPVSWQARETAWRLQQAGAKARRRDEPEPLEAIQAAAAATPTAFFKAQWDDLALCSHALRRLHAALTEACGDAAPALTHLPRLLTEIAAYTRAALMERGHDPAAEPEPEEPASAEDASQSAAAPGDGAPPPPIDIGDLLMSDVDPPAAAPALEPEAGAPPAPEAELPALRAEAPAGPRGIRSRDEAYRLLEMVAAYLRRTEPHSPVPYLLRRAVLWGRMPLAELLPELMQGDGGLMRMLMEERGE